MAEADWEPIPEESVAQHVRRFTHDPNGVQLDGFTEETAIRQSEVERLTVDVVAEIGDVPEPLWELARSVAGMGIASQAVIDLDRDLSRDLWDRYQTKLRDLRSKIASAGGKAHGSQPATGSFPPPYGVAPHVTSPPGVRLRSQVVERRW